MLLCPLFDLFFSSLVFWLKSSVFPVLVVHLFCLFAYFHFWTFLEQTLGLSRLGTLLFGVEIVTVTM